jgi:Spy/CpxP family protein refolding chaperone
MKKATLVLGLLLSIGALAAPANAQQIPDEARRQLSQVLGGQFMIFRDKVQDELKLSNDQQQKLSEQFGPYVQATMQLFEKIKDLEPEEREKELQEHRRKSDEKLSAELKGVLDAKQQARLFQLQLQQGGAFALLGQNEAFLKLKITDEQRTKFMEVVQAMEESIQPLIKEAQSGGNPQEIHPKVMKIRKQHEGKIEAILTSEQKKQWKELLGKPFDLGD